ncbi:MAG: NAD(P)H-dependent oxidoreductase subunit E [Ruminococcaceae bacterium]|nr:NAD(P)H-dependent oxidoreductase subunit E [Oscillospiraceae bacterium]
MQKKRSSFPFTGTPEQEKQLKAIIDANKSDASRLMFVMQEAQHIYGYLPFEVQEMIAEGMGMPIEKVYGISTFYALFSLAPKGKYNISLCMGTACYVKGAQKVMDKLVEILGIGPDECTPDGMFSITPCRCLGACGLAPVMTVNDEVYAAVTPEKVTKLLAELKERG